MAIRYSQLYDAIYDDIELVWLEKKCSDPECEFCADRPEFPEFDKEDRVWNYAKF